MRIQQRLVVGKEEKRNLSSQAWHARTPALSLGCRCSSSTPAVTQNSVGRCHYGDSSAAPRQKKAVVAVAFFSPDNYTLPDIAKYHDQLFCQALYVFSQHDTIVTVLQ
jgi:hypothetical protein